MPFLNGALQGLENSFLRTEHQRKERRNTPPDSPSLFLSLITSVLHHSPSHVLLMYLWNYWNVNAPLLPLIFKTKGYRCAGCTHTDTGPTGNGKGALISLFVMLQSFPPPCVFFWISLVHPSPTSLPFSTRNSRIRKGTAQRATEGWATINEWLFSIHCSHCGCYNWLHLWNHMRCYISVTWEKVQKNPLHGKINDFNRHRFKKKKKAHTLTNMAVALKLWLLIWIYRLFMSKITFYFEV